MEGTKFKDLPQATSISDDNLLFTHDGSGVKGIKYSNVKSVVLKDVNTKITTIQSNITALQTSLDSIKESIVAFDEMGLYIDDDGDLCQKEN